MGSRRGGAQWEDAASLAMHDDGQDSREASAHRIISSLVLFLQERDMYDSYLVWRHDRLRSSLLLSRQRENEELMRYLPNSDESTCSESSETDSSSDDDSETSEPNIMS